MLPLFNHIGKLLARIVDFVLRKRTFAAALMRSGALVVIATLASGWAMGLVYKDASRGLQFNFQTTDGVPPWVVLLAFAVGMAVMLAGVGMGIHDWRRDRNAESKCKAIVVEMRGLHLSPDTPASRANLGLGKGVFDWHSVDFRPPSEGQMVDPELALEKISAVKRSVETACGGRAKEDLTVALGGLAAVPCLFLIGLLFDDETNVVVYDWDRNRKAWRLTDDLDDGKRFLPFAPVVPPNTKEAVLAVSASYPVDESAIARGFDTNLPVVHLRSEEMLADRFWSAEKQQAFVTDFRDAVQQLMSLGVVRIHLVLAAPASLSIRMGMAYDRRLMPDLVVYQYERTAVDPYPWGYRMPTHGRRAATLERKMI